MKKLIIIFAFLITAVFTVNAQTSVKVFQKITSADTVQVEIVLNAQVNSGPQVLYIQTDPNNTGTIQFAVGEVINSSYYAYPAGSKIVVRIKNGSKNLRYKASAASQSFIITQ